MIRAASSRALRGWTLLEMVIVIAIVAGISLAVLAVAGHGREQGAEQASEGNLRRLATDAETYSLTWGRYPSGASVPATFALPTPPPGSAGPPPLEGEPVVSPLTNDPYTITPGALSYVITDPATYATSTLSHLPQGNPATGAITNPPTLCTSCTHLAYGKSGGTFGY